MDHVIKRAVDAGSFILLTVRSAGSPTAYSLLCNPSSDIMRSWDTERILSVEIGTIPSADLFPRVVVSMSELIQGLELSLLLFDKEP